MMITVNLRPGLKRKGGGIRLAGRGRARQGTGIEGQGSAAHRPWSPRGWACGRLAGFGSGSAMHNRNSRTWQPRLEQARTENKRFKTFMQQKQKQERSATRCWPRSA